MLPQLWRGETQGHQRQSEDEPRLNRREADGQNPTPDARDVTMEFGVDLTCGNCVRKTEEALRKESGVSGFEVDLEKQSVLVTSSLPSDLVRTAIESTGKRAVFLGMASGSSKPGAAAVAMLGGMTGCGNESVRGVVRLLQYGPGNCVVDGSIDGLSPGEHALAIHESGDLSEGCLSVGDHYNPKGVRHGSPLNGEHERHVGDLGNVLADGSGRAIFRFSDTLLNVQDVIGRAMVVADSKDDYGTGATPLSLVNGNCGKRLACGIIARSAGLFENPKRMCACDGVSLWDERDKPLAGPGRSSLKN